MKKVVFYFFTALFMQVVCSVPLALYANVSGQQMTADLILMASAVSNLLTILLFTIQKWHPFSLAYLKTKPFVTLYWTVLVAVAMLIPSAFLEEMIPESLTEDLVNMEAMMASPWAILSVCIMAPIAEEIVCRGAIQRELVKYFSAIGSNNRFLANERRRTWLPLVITAMLFSAMHGNPAQMPHAFLIGLLLSWLAYCSGSIVPGILLHAINNSLAVVMYHLYPQSVDMKMIEFFGNSDLRLAGAVTLSTLLFVYAIYQLYRHLKTQKVHTL